MVLNLTELNRSWEDASHQPWTFRSGVVEISHGSFNQYWEAIGGFGRLEDGKFAINACNNFKQMLEIIAKAKVYAEACEAKQNLESSKNFQRATEAYSAMAKLLEEVEFGKPLSGRLRTGGCKC